MASTAPMISGPARRLLVMVSPNPDWPSVLGDQVGELSGVLGGVVAVAVVEQDVSLLRLLSQRLDTRRPLPKLLLRVVVLEPLDHRDASLPPYLAPPPVEPHQSQTVRGGLCQRGDARGETLRHVHAHEGDLLAPEEVERAARGVLIGEPRRLAELDPDVVVGEALPAR